RLALAAHDDRATHAALLVQDAHAAQIALVHTSRPLDLDGQLHVADDKVDFLARAGSPETDRRVGLAIGLPGAQLHQDPVLEGLAELGAAGSRLTACKEVRDPHVEQEELLGLDEPTAAATFAMEAPGSRATCPRGCRSRCARPSPTRPSHEQRSYS